MPGFGARLEHRLDPSLVLSPPLPELLGILTCQCRELVQEHPDVIGVADDDIEQFLTEHGQLVRRRPAGQRGAIGTDHDLVHHPIVDGGEQFLLRTDVVVEGTLPELVRLTELDRTGGVVAPLGEDLGRAVDDGLPAQVPFRAPVGIVLGVAMGSFAWGAVPLGIF